MNSFTEITGTPNMFRNMRETVEFSPVSVEQQGKESADDKSARSSDALERREDSFTLSERGRAAAELEQPGAVQNDNASPEQRQKDDLESGNPRDPKEESESDGEKPRAAGDASLDEADQSMLQELRSTDQKVRAHEQAHASAGGHNVRYDYQTGPDGRQYAVGGTTDIEVYASSTDANGKLAQAAKMRAAALAPADPSAQDMNVAAKASRMEMDARREKANAELEEMVASAQTKPNAGPYDFL